MHGDAKASFRNTDLSNQPVVAGLVDDAVMLANVVVDVLLVDDVVAAEVVVGAAWDVSVVGDAVDAEVSVQRKNCAVCSKTVTAESSAF